SRAPSSAASGRRGLASSSLRCSSRSILAGRVETLLASTRPTRHSPWIREAMPYEPEDRGPAAGPGTDRAEPSAGSPRPKRPPAGGGGAGGRGAAGRPAAAKAKTIMSIVNEPRARATPAGLEIAEEAQALVAEANANTQAMIATINAIIRAETTQE